MTLDDVKFFYLCIFILALLFGVLLHAMKGGFTPIHVTLLIYLTLCQVVVCIVGFFKDR